MCVRVCRWRGRRCVPLDRARDQLQNWSFRVWHPQNRAHPCLLLQPQAWGELGEGKGRHAQRPGLPPHPQRPVVRREPMEVPLSSERADRRSRHTNSAHPCWTASSSWWHLWGGVCVCLDVEQMCALGHTRAWVRVCRCGCAYVPLSAPQQMLSVSDVRGGSQPVNYMWPASQREVVWGGSRGGACAAVSRNPSLT